MNLGGKISCTLIVVFLTILTVKGILKHEGEVALEESIESCETAIKKSKSRGDKIRNRCLSVVLKSVNIGRKAIRYICYVYTLRLAYIYVLYIKDVILGGIN